MVIKDGHTGWSVFSPDENNAPLVIDADGVGTGKSALQCLQAIARRHGEIRQDPGSVHLNEFAESDPSDGGMAPIALPAEEFLGIVIGKGLNHGFALSGFNTASQVTSSQSPSSALGVSARVGNSPPRLESSEVAARFWKVRSMEARALVARTS